MDFEANADRVLQMDNLPVLTHPSNRDVLKMYLVSLQRDAWNARGKADVHAIDERLATLTGWVTSEPYRNQIQDAVKAVDR